METFHKLVILVGTISFIGVAIYTIASLFYLLPRFGEFLTRKELIAALPPRLHRFGSLCIYAFVGCLVFSFVLDFLVGLFHHSSN